MLSIPPCAVHYHPIDVSNLLRWDGSLAHLSVLQWGVSSYPSHIAVRRANHQRRSGQSATEFAVTVCLPGLTRPTGYCCGSAPARSTSWPSGSTPTTRSYLLSCLILLFLFTSRCQIFWNTFTFPYSFSVPFHNSFHCPPTKYAPAPPPHHVLPLLLSNTGPSVGHPRAVRRELWGAACNVDSLQGSRALGAHRMLVTFCLFP